MHGDERRSIKRCMGSGHSVGVERENPVAGSGKWAAAAGDDMLLRVQVWFRSEPVALGMWEIIISVGTTGWNEVGRSTLAVEILKFEVR